MIPYGTPTIQISREDLVTEVDELVLVRDDLPQDQANRIRETARVIKGWRAGGTAGMDVPSCRCLVQVALNTNSLRGNAAAAYVGCRLDGFVRYRNTREHWGSNQVEVIG